MTSEVTQRDQVFQVALEGLTLPTQGREADVLARVKRVIASTPLRSPSPGDVVAGRYGLIRVLGKGGMGVVWLARDRELDREVAIKILTGVEDGVLFPRMRREARAAATIAHPNVAAVFDVDFDARPPFIVMEYVEGGDLRAWLQREPRRQWQSIVATFEQAGAGLSAAHGAGLVHRDFKPANVLVGGGRVRVADFGLARAAVGCGGDDRGPTPSVSADVTLTGSDLAVGTPAYMAPEQHRGGSVGPAADIFAFACSLYEGLYGQRPYTGRDGSELLRAKQKGPPPAPPNPQVPHRVYAVVARGLAADPAARWPSMPTFLAALRRSRRRIRASSVAATFLGVSIVAALLPRSEPLSSCPLELTSFETESEGLHRAVTRAFDRSTTKPRLRGLTARTLDDFQAEWAAAWTRACEHRGTPRPSETRMACLRSVRRAAAEQLRRAGASPEDADRFAGRLHHFPQIRECDDDVQERLQRLPSDPEARLEIENLQAWARSEPILVEDGQDGSALIERARRTGHLPTLAAVQLAVSMRAYRNGELETAQLECDHAYRTAVEGGADWVANRAAQHCTIVSAVFGDVDEARRWDRTVAAIHLRLGVDPHERVETRSFLASALARAGALDEARDLSAELYEQSLEAPEHHLAVIVALGEIGHVSVWLDDFEAAVERLEESLRRAELYYSENPDVISSCEGKLATSYRYVGRYDDAEVLHERLLTRALAPQARLVNMLNYAQMLGDQPERLPDARRILEQALLETGTRPQSLDFANVLASLGQIEFKSNRFGEARAALQGAREIYSAKLSAEHIRIQNVDEWMAKVEAAERHMGT